MIAWGAKTLVIKQERVTIYSAGEKRMLKYNIELGQGVTDELAGVILLQYQTGAFPRLYPPKLHAKV